MDLFSFLTLSLGREAEGGDGVPPWVSHTIGQQPRVDREAVGAQFEVCRVRVGSRLG